MAKLACLPAIFAFSTQAFWTGHWQKGSRLRRRPRSQPRHWPSAIGPCGRRPSLPGDALAGSQDLGRRRPHVLPGRNVSQWGPRPSRILPGSGHAASGQSPDTIFSCISVCSARRSILRQSHAASCHTHTRAHPSTSSQHWFSWPHVPHVSHTPAPAVPGPTPRWPAIGPEIRLESHL